MSSKLPVVSGHNAVKVFEKAGWRIVRQKGSHLMLTKPGRKNTLSVPQHHELAKGTLKALIEAAELTTDQFCRLLR